MMTSVTPKVRRRVRVISRRVRLLSSTRALGRVSVRGLRRVPRPAARIMAFIGEPKKKNLHRGHAEHRGHREEGCEEHLRERSASEGGPYNGEERRSGASFGQFLEFQVAQDDFQTGAGAEALG